MRTYIQKGTSKNQKGFTLIELLIVIGLMAMLMGLAVGFLGNSFNSQAKKQSRHLISIIKYAYNQANVSGHVYRLVFDMDEQTYWLEEGPDKVVVSAKDADKDESKKKSKKETDNPDKENNDEEKGGASEETDEADEPKTAANSFMPVDSDVVKKVNLGDVVYLRDIFVTHQTGIAEEGQSYLYFFPTGITEFAVIHLSNEEHNYSYTLIVNPVSGVVKVENDYIEYESLLEK